MRNISFISILSVGLALLCPTLSAQTLPTDHSAECVQKLRVIYKALRSYAREHQRLPDQLSDLIPKYLPDKDALHCPDDDDSGFIGYKAAHKDPRMPISYSYEMSADPSPGLPYYPGPTPHYDGSQGWGTCRQFSVWLQRFFGDAVPLIRCYNHRRFSDPKARDDVLNLTENGVVYRSGMQWDASEAGCVGLAVCMQRDLNKGIPVFERNWFLGGIDGRISETVAISIWDGLNVSPTARARLRSVVHTLQQSAPRLRAASLAYRIASRFAAAVGDKAEAIQLAQKSLAEEARTQERENTRILLTHLYESNRQPAKALPLIQKLHTDNPNSRFFMEMLGDVYARLGKTREAELWNRQANPLPPLVGQQGADLALKTLTGGQDSLKAIRQGKKALILTFWYIGCPPCRAELPHLQTLYREYRDQGLEILAVNPVDRPEEIRSFVGRAGYTFPFARVQPSGNPHEDLLRQYHVEAFPTCYLLDENGKIVWGTVGFGEETAHSLRAALATLGFGSGAAMSVSSNLSPQGNSIFR